VEQQTAIFWGPQGSGKGTQVTLFKEYLAKNDSERTVVHFDAGAAIRAFCAEPGYTQEQVRKSVEKGELQPDFITTSLMSKMFISAMHGNEHLIIDGFPRTLDQYAIFDSAIRFYSREKPAILYIDISEEESVRRMLKRGRADDTEDSIRRRLAWTKETFSHVVELLRHNSFYRFIEINGEQSIDDVHREILGKLELNG